MARTGKKNPSDIWFWEDYANDLELKSVSLAAQGLWMRMLYVAARAQPRGYVKLGPEPCTVENLAEPLARLVGEGKEKVMELVDELIRAGVCGVTRSGIVFSRRMVRAANISETRSKAGKKGADARYGNEKEISGLPWQKPSKGGGKTLANGTRLHSSSYNYPLNPPATGGPEILEDERGKTNAPTCIAGHSVVELRVKAAALGRGGAGAEATARGLGTVVLREMVRHGLLPPEVGEKFGVKVREAA